jgi:integrase
MRGSEMRALIGQKLIDKLKPKDKPYEVRDTRLKGFLVRVQPSGAMSYIVEWGRGKRLTLRGKTGALKPAPARELARIHLGTVARGEDPRTAKREEKIPTFKAFVEETFRPWAEGHHRNAKESVRKLESFYEYIGSRKLNEITPWHIEKRRSVRLKEGIKPASENRDLDALKGALNKAVEWRKIESNPLAGVKRLKTDTAARIRFLEPDEETRLRSALDAREERRREERASHNKWRKERGYRLLPEFGTYTDYLKPLVILDLNTGLRRGELFNLEWADIDLPRAILTVVGAGAKSQKTRHIPLNREATEVLGAWREQSADASGNVFPGRDGKRFNNVKRSWEKILQDAKIAGFRFHDLRHDFASKLVMAGVDLNTVRELLGHSDLKMTLRYAHLAPEHKAAAVGKLDEARAMAEEERKVRDSA